MRRRDGSVTFAMLGDRLPCPALSRLLPVLLPEPCAYWVLPGYTVPRDLRRPCAEVPPLGEPESTRGLAGLLVIGSIPWPAAADGLALPDEILQVLRPGGALVEVDTPRRPRLFGPRDDLYAAAADRLASLLDRGIVDVEQWVTIDPPDTLVTWGRLGAWALSS